jgi:hypothetical protein
MCATLTYPPLPHARVSVGDGRTTCRSPATRASRTRGRIGWPPSITFGPPNSEAHRPYSSTNNARLRVTGLLRSMRALPPRWPDGAVRPRHRATRSASRPGDMRAPAGLRGLAERGSRFCRQCIGRALCARALQPQRLDDFMTRGPLAKQGRKRSSRLVNQPLLVSVVHLPAHRRNERAQLVVIAAASRHSGGA